MGGILTCLHRSSREKNLVLSYDMPRISPGLILYLLEHSEDYQLVVPALDSSLPEPLCALYSKSMIPVLESMAERGEYALHKALPYCRSKILLIGPDLPFYRPDLFMNLNTPQDLEQSGQ